MKLGLVRHFKVNTNRIQGEIDWQEYKQLMEEYDVLDVTESEVDMKGIDWNKCYSSTLTRAKKTAETIYDGEIIESDLIVEVDYKVVDRIEGRYPMNVWSIYSMISWAQERDSVYEVRSETVKRINKFMDGLEKEANRDDNILIVCHGMLMNVFQDVLKERGYDGPDIVFPKNGELFVFEK